jgi:hypothetical protein
MIYNLGLYLIKLTAKAACGSKHGPDPSHRIILHDSSEVSTYRSGQHCHNFLDLLMENKTIQSTTGLDRLECTGVLKMEEKNLLGQEEIGNI